MGCFGGLSSKNPNSRLFLIRRGSERFLRKALKRNSAVYSVNAAFARGQKYKESKFRKLKIDDNNEVETKKDTESDKTDRSYESNTPKDGKIEDEGEEEITKSTIAPKNDSQTRLESNEEEQSVENEVSQTTIECRSSELANKKLDHTKTDQYETQGKSSTQNINERCIKIYPYPELEGLLAQYSQNNHEANNKTKSLEKRKIQNPFLRKISIKTNSLSRETENQDNRYGSFVSAKVREFEAKLQESDMPMKNKYKFISDETQVMPSPISKVPTSRICQKRGGNNNNGHFIANGTIENTQIENSILPKWNNSELPPVGPDTIENSSFNLESLLTQVSPFRTKYEKQSSGVNDVTYDGTDDVVDIQEEEAKLTEESDKDSDQTLEPEEHQPDFEEVATYNHNASRKSLFPNLSNLNGLPELGVDSSFESTAAEGQRITVEVQIETDTYQRWLRNQKTEQEESTENEDEQFGSLDRRGPQQKMVGRISDLKLQKFDTLFKQTALRNLYKMREKAHRERMMNETSTDDVNSRFILNCFGPSKRSKEM